VASGPVTSCGLCGDRTRFTKILDLGNQPLAERDDGRRYPLGLLECGSCGLIQLSYMVNRREVFPPEHPYATGNTRAMRLHFGELAAEATLLMDDRDLAVDIGANDGTLLAAVRRRMPPVRLLGIEPTGQARGCRAKAIPVEQAFFSSGLARDIVRYQGQAKVVTACNVLAHCEDPHDFAKGVALLLAPGGTFITENHDAAAVTGGLQIDTVYHEHLRFWTAATLGRLLEQHGFLITRTENIATHGGSLRTYAKLRPRSLQQRAETARDQLGRLMETASGDGPVWGIGAATRATGLIHFAGLERWIHQIAEVPGSGKIGSCMPGTQIKVADEAEMIAAQPPYAVLFAWHVADDIVPKLRAAGYEGRVIIPLPQARIYRG
jgi:hypothetical protein